MASPVHFELTRSLSFLPGGRLDIGRVHAEGTGIHNATTANRIWVSSGLVGRLVWVPVVPLVVDCQAAVLVPLTPYEFDFLVNTVIYDAPSVAFSSSLSVGLQFL